MSANSLNFGIFGQFLGVSLTLVHLFIMFVYESCSYNMTYSNPKDFYSRADSKLMILLKAFYFLQCFLYSTFQITNYESYLEFMTFFYFFIAVLTVYYVPFHSFFTNCVVICLHVDLFCIILFFLIQNLTSTIQMAFVLTIFMQPIIIFVSFEITRYRLSHFEDILSLKESSYENFEHSSRKHLESGDLGLEMLKIMNNFAKSNKNELIHILQANYANDVLNNCEVAMLKIESAEFSIINISLNYQIFKCKQLIQHLNLEVSSSLKLYLFLNELIKAKENDLDLCFTLQNFIAKIIDPNQTLSEMKKIVHQSYELMKTTKDTYKSLIKKEPESSIVLDLYSSLLMDIFQDIEKGSKYTNKKYYNLRKNEKYSTSLDSENPIILVSGTTETFGKIIFANEKALQFLEQTSETIQDCYLNQFIPTPFQKTHDAIMNHFINNCTQTVISCAKFPFLSINGFLTQCELCIDCVAYDGKANFLCVMKNS